MENFSQPIMQPSDFHSHRTRNIIITVVIITVAIFYLWKYKGGFFTSSTQSTGLSPEKKAILDSLVSSGSGSDNTTLQNTLTAGSVKGTKGEAINSGRVTDTEKIYLWKMTAGFKKK